MRRPFNQLTPAQVERLALLMEELAEAIQATGKILRHGYESRHSNRTNREDLERELGDVYHAISRLVWARELDHDEIVKASEQKAESVMAYLHHQRDRKRA